MQKIENASPAQPRHFQAAETLDGIFEDRVSHTPKKTAVRTPAGSCSYAKLNQNANRIAHALLGETARKSARVALYFDPGSQAIAAILGSLKAGKCYIPLDPGDPEERLCQIMEDSSPELILTDDAHLQWVKTSLGSSCPILNVSELDERLPVTNPGIGNLPQSLAYIFYTSGSSGRPKGVCQTHENIIHYVDSYSSTLELQPKDSISLLFSLSFSASNMDIYGALLNGATLCPYNVRREGIESLRFWLEAQSITVLHMVPSLFRYLVSGLATDKKLPSVRAIDLGGEAIYQTDLELFRKHFPEDANLYNHFAATELSVICQYKCGAEGVLEHDILPVGKPAQDVELYILDGNGHAVNSGETGEIHIQSPYLSPGYWNQPELNRTAFQAAEGRQGWRTYRTGDFGYRDEKGHLFVAGRSDSRVKVRGHSVDLSQVEVAINQLELATEIAVIFKPAPDDRLAAYLAGVSPEDQHRSAIRLRLQRKLPRYMIPAEIQFVDHLPKTPSGKIQRQALGQLQPRDIPRGDQASQMTSHSRWEHDIETMFRELLDDHAQDSDDDFFALGGDSLQFMTLHTMIEKHFGLFIGIDEILQDPSIAGIAVRLEKKSAERAVNVAPQRMMLPVRPLGTGTPFFVVHGANGHAFVSPKFMDLLGAGRPFFAFQARGLDGRSQPHKSIRVMAADYVTELKKQQAQGPYMLGGICAGGVIAIEMAHQMRQAGDTVAPLLLIDPYFHGMQRSRINIKQLLRAHLRYFYKQWSYALNRKDHQENLMIEMVRRRMAKGAMAAGKKGDVAIGSSVHVENRLQLALARHRPSPYSGDIYLLSSKKRKRQDYTRFGLVGEVRSYVVAAKHENVLDVNNRRFAKRMKACVRDILSVVECH
jgi:amino acid adenylation domain-containing protein